MSTRVIADTIGCVWTGEFDLNTLRVDGEIFESGKKKLSCGFKYIPGYVRTGPKSSSRTISTMSCKFCVWFCVSFFLNQNNVNYSCRRR